jgi:UDP-N-acetylglucosamine 2-epimerase (non-hydrolysing)
MWPLITAGRERANLEIVVCNTGQHAALVTEAMQALRITPNIDLHLMTHDQSLAGLSSTLLTNVDRVLDQVRPDFVLVQGDTATAFITSVAAFYRRIPLGHVEAGLRSRDLSSPFPEEGNRLMIAQTALHHYAPTQRNVDSLVAEGLDPNRVYLTGNTIVDSVLQMEQEASNWSWANATFGTHVPILYL